MKEWALTFAADYLNHLQNTINGNYTNVCQIKIYQLVDIFLCEKNVNKEERRNLPSALRWLSPVFVCFVCNYKKYIFAKLFKNSFTFKKQFIRPSNVFSTSKFAEDRIKKNDYSGIRLGILRELLYIFY